MESVPPCSQPFALSSLLQPSARCPLPLLLERDEWVSEHNLNFHAIESCPKLRTEGCRFVDVDHYRSFCVIVRCSSDSGAHNARCRHEVVAVYLEHRPRSIGSVLW